MTWLSVYVFGCLFHLGVVVCFFLCNYIAIHIISFFRPILSMYKIEINMLNVRWGRFFVDVAYFLPIFYSVASYDSIVSPQQRSPPSGTMEVLEVGMKRCVDGCPASSNSNGACVGSGNGSPQEAIAASRASSSSSRASSASSKLANRAASKLFTLIPDVSMMTGIAASNGSVSATFQPRSRPGGREK